MEIVKFMDIPMWIRKERKKQGYKQKHLGLKAGYTGDYISSIESRRNTIPLYTLENIASALGYDLVIGMVKKDGKNSN